MGINLHAWTDPWTLDFRLAKSFEGSSSSVQGSVAYCHEIYLHDYRQLIYNQSLAPYPETDPSHKPQATSACDNMSH